MTDSDAKTLAEQLERRNKEIEIIERVASQISKTLNLDAIAKTMLISMEEYFDFKHSMILLLDGSESTLKVIATHGYKEEGIGAEVKIGVGVIGMVAKKKKLMRMANLGAQMQYMQAIKQQIQPSEDIVVADEISLPGLKNAESQVAIPMLMEDELIGVFSVDHSLPKILQSIRLPSTLVLQPDSQRFSDQEDLFHPQLLYLLTVGFVV